MATDPSRQRRQAHKRRKKDIEAKKPSVVTWRQRLEAKQAQERQRREQATFNPFDAGLGMSAAAAALLLGMGRRRS